jgi:hypothetical protein
MTKSEAIKQIERCFWRLARCCEHKDEWDRYLDLIKQEETEHRVFKPEGVQCGLTRAQSIRLFAVKEVFDRFVSRSGESIFTPEAKDYFHIRKSVFGVCAIVDMCGERITAEFSNAEMADWLSQIDYAKLNRDSRFVEAT